MWTNYGEVNGEQFGFLPFESQFNMTLNPTIFPQPIPLENVEEVIDNTSHVDRRLIDATNSPDFEQRIQQGLYQALNPEPTAEEQQVKAEKEQQKQMIQGLIPLPSFILNPITNFAKKTWDKIRGIFGSSKAKKKRRRRKKMAILRKQDVTHYFNGGGTFLGLNDQERIQNATAEIARIFQDYVNYIQRFSLEEAYTKNIIPLEHRKPFEAFLRTGRIV